MHLTNARSHFSLGRAVSSVDAIVKKALEMGYQSVILADDATISGMTDLVKAMPEDCRAKAIKGV